MEVWVQLKHQKCTHDLHTGADGSASTGDSPHSGEVDMEWCAVEPYDDESKTEGKEKISQLSAMTCRVQVVAESLGVFSLRGLGGSQHTSA